MPYSDKKEQLYRDIILDHYKSPRNRGLVDDATYETVHLKNPSCGDDLIMQVKRADDLVADVRFMGDGCAICCASASMMSENIKGKTSGEAATIIREFYAMVSGQPSFDEAVLDEAVSLQGVAKLPPRIKCASLGYKAVEQILFGKDATDDDIKEIK